MDLRAGFNYAANPVKEHNGWNPQGVTSIQGTAIPTFGYEMFRNIGFPAIVESHLTLGFGYQLTETLTVNVAYAVSYTVANVDASTTATVTFTSSGGGAPTGAVADKKGLFEIADEGTLFISQMPVQRAVGYKLAVRGVFGSHASEALKLLPCESDADVKAAFSRLTTVTAFVGPARSLVKAMGKKQSPPFLYHFTCVSPAMKQRGMGATHAAEIPYVFGTQRTGPECA